MTNTLVIVDEGGNNVILQKLILSVADRPDLELDLKGFCILYFHASIHPFRACIAHRRSNTV